MNAAKLVQRKDWPWKQCPLAYESITITEYDHEEHELKCHSNTNSEPLPELAVETFDVAARQCASCRDTHTLWPYIRLSRTSIGAEREGSRLEPLLAELLPERPVILIAGAADTGLLALVARATSSDAEITVLDRCDTPLEMCRRLSARWGRLIATLHQDLRDLDIRDQFDLVLLHHTLQFVPAEHRMTVLLNLARALHPNGYLVHSFNVSRSLSGALGAEHRDVYPRLGAGRTRTH